MEIEDRIDIQVIGDLLMFYESDLGYIRNFQLFKKGEISPGAYCEKKQGTFYSFLIEFRVTRNFEKNKVDRLLEITRDWVINESSDRVDEFAIHLNDEGITHGKIMTVMASKILFLNKPWKILPMDSLGKFAVGQIDNSYENYMTRIREVREQILPNIKKKLSRVEPYLEQIEDLYYPVLKEPTVIRENRFIDKLLWTLGKSGRTFYGDYALKQ